MERENLFNRINPLAFTVKNLERTYNSLKKRCKFKSKLQNSPDGYAKVAFLVARKFNA